MGSRRVDRPPCANAHDPAAGPWVGRSPRDRITEHRTVSIFRSLLGGEHGYTAGNRQGTEIAMKIAFAAVEVAVVELLVVGA